MKITKSNIPDDSLIFNSFNKDHYTDTFKCTFDSEKEFRVEDFVYAFFDSSPLWLKRLFKLRNKVVGLLGLKTGDADNLNTMRKNFKVQKGHALGLFRILDVNKQEVLMGEDDWHLNFRISFIITYSPTGSYEFTLPTTVHFNNFVGRLYFLFVKPFHKIIVPAMIKSIVKHLHKKDLAE